MAFLFENKDRRVIPNWRPYNQTLILGEVDTPFLGSNKNYPIIKYIQDWRNNKTVIHAGDLLSAAISNNQREEEAVLDAALFIKENWNKTSYAQKELCERITTSNVIFESRKELDSKITSNNVITQIKILKELIRLEPYNSINYVELSRSYANIGCEHKSKTMMDIAIHLSPNNRYVIRSAVRLYIHYNNLDYAHYILKKTPSLIYDPWLIATELSLCTMLQKNSRLIKKAINILQSNKYSPFSISELFSSVATIEYIQGSTKRSRDYFNKSLIAPNDNSLAQAEWALSNKVPIIINREMPVKLSHEAKTIHHLYTEDYNHAINYAIDWINDMQFAKRPILIGADIAYTYLKDFELAEKILSIGLTSNPRDPQLLNNLAYAYAMNFNVEKAQECIKDIDKIDSSIIDKSTKICIIATKGLLAFRTGKVEIGRYNYEKAIEAASLLHDTPTYYWSAILNYIREELLYCKHASPELVSQIDKIKEGPCDKDIKQLKKDIININNQYQV